MKFKHLALVLLVFITPFTVQAKQVAGISLPETISFNNHQLQLNGAGVRDKFFIDLYVGSLYLTNKTDQLKQVLTQPAVLIRLNVISGLITAERMTSAITEGFELATNDNTQDIATEIDQFMHLFKDKIEKGDQFSFMIYPSRVICYKNDKQLSQIDSAPFAKALLKIWLGEKPAQQSLKQAMLGN